MHAFRKEFGSVLQVLIWGAGIWLAIGLLGSLRWFSPTASPSSAVLLAVSVKVGVLLALIAAFYLHETFFGASSASRGRVSNPTPAAPVGNHVVQW